MRILVALLALSLPALASTVTCTGSDASAIQTSLNGGGTTTLIGSCNIGGTTLGTAANGTTLTTSSGASVTYTGSGFALNINHNNVTVSNITWMGGGLHTTQTSQVTPQSGITITGNTIQNLTMTNSNNVAILGDGYWSNVTITNNTIKNISSVPTGSISTSTNVENCSSPNHCSSDNYPCTFGPNLCYGSGITNLNGLDNVTIQFNHFDVILGNAMSLKFDWTIGKTPGNFTNADNNNWSYNTATNMHRMFEESGGGGNSCPGGCAYGNTYKITNWKIAGNFGTYLAPYGDSYGLSIPNNAAAPQIINNTFALTAPAGAGFTYEDGNQNELFQGNVASQPSGAGSWGAQNSSANQAYGYTVIQQNNLFFGAPGTLAGMYYEPEGPSTPVPPYGGTFTNRYNLNGATCSGSCSSSTLSTAFLTSGSPTSSCTPNGASFPTGGNGTWCTYAAGQISIRNVVYSVDGTPVVTQEIQDLSTTFGSDARWQYHATINTSTLSGGSHTITALTTDVSGATSSHSQTFATGSGPGASFSPTTLAYGVITLGNTSSPQSTTLTNTGSTTLTISSAPSLTGANAGDFTITGTTCGGTLAASATCTVTATFTPTALGSRVAFITITDNAAGSPHTVQLTGGASTCLSGNLVTNCDFGTGVQSPWGFASSFATLAIDNTGPSGTYAAHITATSSVPPGNNTELFEDSLTPPANGTMMQLTFSCLATRPQAVNILGILSVSPYTSFGLAWMPTFPTSYGTYPNCKSPYFKVINGLAAGTARLTFQADNSTAGDQFQITNVNLVSAGSVPASQPSVTSVAFTPTNTGTTQTGAPFSVTNGGIANLVISALTSSGDFSQTNTCGTLPATIAPGSSCTITPTFTPTIPGGRIGTLTITSNDSSVSPQTIPESGTGVGSNEVLTLEPLIVSHGSIYFDMTTQTDSNGIRIRYGTTSCAAAPTPDNNSTWLQTNFINNVPHAFSAFTIGGLPAATIINICPEVTKDAGTTWSTGANFTVMTLPLPNPHPALPKPPLTVNTNYPDTSGYFVDTSISSACTNTEVGAAYSAAVGRWATQGTVVKIPAGGLCNAGPYAFSSTPPDVHTIAVSDVTLPSTIHWPSHGFAEGDLVLFGRTYGLNVTYPGGGGCNVGQGTIVTGGIQSGQRYQVHLVDANNIQVRCLPVYQPDPSIPPATPPIMVWTSAPTASGSDHMLAVPFHSTGTDANGLPIWERRLPGGATTPYIIFQTAGVLPPEHTAITPAWSANLFKFQDPVSNISSGALQHNFIIFGDAVDANVEIPIGPIRIVGAEITTDNYVPVSSDPYFWSGLWVTYPWTDGVICDRCYYHIPDGNREFRGWQWDGSNLGWVGGHHDNLAYMKSAVVGLAVTGSSHTISITAGSNYIPNLSHYTLAFNETITLSGSGTGRVRAYFDLANGGAFTVAVPASVTASCSPITCLTPASSGSTSGSCLASIDPTNSATYADLPHYGSGESSAASIGCADVTSGSITSVGPYNTSVSQWNAEGDSHMIGGCGPGPYDFENNYYDGAGITWHFDDSCGFRFRGNYRWNRNYGKASTKWMFGSPDSLHMVPGNRQQLEWKAGQFGEIKGNVFDGSFRDVIPDSGAIAWQPLSGGLTTDFNFVSNTVKNGSSIMQGPTNTCGGTAISCGLAMRFHFDNTLTYNINGYFFTSPNPNGSNGPGLGWANQFNAVEDAFIEHQTDGTPSRGATSWLLSNTSLAIEGYTDVNSIHFFNGVPTQVTSQYGDGSGAAPPPGCNGLANFALMNCQFTAGRLPAYNFANLLAGGYTDNSGPSGQSTVSTMTTAFGSLPNLYLASGSVSGTTSAIKWSNPTTDNRANYHLAWNSPYTAGANSITHAGPLGIEADRLDADQGLLKMGNVTFPSGVPTINYYAADSGVCHVLLSTTNDISTTPANPLADAGSARARSVAMTGLTSGTVYYGWVLCPGNSVMSQSPVFSFKTH